MISMPAGMTSLTGPRLLSALAAALVLWSGQAAADCTCAPDTARREAAPMETASRHSAIRDGFRLMEARARRGDVPAMRLTGLWMAQGIGTPLDYKRAYYWLWRAAARGDAIARNVIGEVARRLTPEEQRKARLARFGVSR